MSFDRVDLDRLQVLAPYRLVIDEINEDRSPKGVGIGSDRYVQWFGTV